MNMKKLIISITAAFCILLGILLFGKFISLSNNQNISQKIQENLSLDNKNIKLIIIKLKDLNLKI